MRYNKHIKKCKKKNIPNRTREKVFLTALGKRLLPRTGIEPVFSGPQPEVLTTIRSRLHFVQSDGSTYCVVLFSRKIASRLMCLFSRQIASRIEWYVL
jgi:hypothetical protein